MIHFYGNIQGHNVIAGVTTNGGITNIYNDRQATHGTTSPSPHKPFSTVPFTPNPDFVNRPEIVAWLHDKLKLAGARAALVGLGGIGKSQLAIHYAHSILDVAPHPFVFWVHGGTKARFEEAYKGLANRLKLPGGDQPNVDVLKLVSEWLQDEGNGRWIMVLDNADGIETSAWLAEYLPRSRNGRILITSRNKEAACRLAGEHANVKEVSIMNEAQGVQLLRSKLQHEWQKEGAGDLVRALGCMPLVISQAAAFINRRHGMTGRSYLNEFRKGSKSKESLLNWEAEGFHRDQSASHAVVATWQISFEDIRVKRASAADLLSLMSHFNPQGIPVWVLRRYSQNAVQFRRKPNQSDDKDEDEDEDEDEDAVNKAFNEDMDVLQAYSLISATADAKVCEMHPLVQFCTQLWQSSMGDEDRWRCEFVKLMAQEFTVSRYYKNLAQCQQLLPHVEPLFDLDTDTGPAREELLMSWSTLVMNAADYLRMHGSLDTAEGLATKALAIQERIFGPDGEEDKRIIECVRVLELVLACQGNYKEAEELRWRVLKSVEKRLGPMSSDALYARLRVGELLSLQVKNNEAEAVLRQALEEMEKVHDSQDTHLLYCTSMLGKVLACQGKLEEAERRCRQALAGMREVHGEHDPGTLKCMFHLVRVLRRQGEYEEAVALSRLALRRYDTVWGGQHNFTLYPVYELAWSLADQSGGKSEEAEALFRRALAGREKSLGALHPLALQSVHGLAWVLHCQKRYAEARPLYQRACDGYVHILGPQHSITIECLRDFAAMERKSSSFFTRLKLRLRTTDRNHASP